MAAGQALRRVRRSAGAATALPVARWHDARRPGVADLLHDLRDTPELDAFVEEQLGPLLADASPRSRALLETLEAYLAAGGRKAEAARALHLERQSLYLRLRRIEETLGVSLDDEDVVLGLHLAVRALRFRRGLDGPSGQRRRTRRSAHWSAPGGRASMDCMTVADTVGTESLQEQAHRHLLMHFTRNGAFGPDGKPLLVLERGEGAYVFDTDGKRYFDGLSSLFCCQIGYSFGEEMAAVASAQMSTLAFNTNWATAHPPAIQLAAALAERAPGDLNRVFFTNGGSESVEAAWKIVRQHYLAKGEPQRTKAIAREIAYHGVTLGALSFTGVRPMKEPFGAAPIPVVRISNTNRYRDPDGRGRGRALRAAAGRGRAHDRRGRAGDGRDADRRAGPERRRLPRPARRATGPGCARCATSTGSRWWPTRSSPASGASASGSRPRATAWRRT